METIHVFRAICQQKQVSHVSYTWATTKETFECQSNFRCKQKKERRALKSTYILCKWKPSMYPEPYANKNKLVMFLIPELRQAKDYYAKDYKRSCFGSEIKGRNSWNLTACTNTHDRLKVRNTSRTCQKIIKPLSLRWATTKEELHIKGMKWVAKGVKKLQRLELTRCSHVGLFVDSHPKFTCQTQSISGSHTWARANNSSTTKSQNEK